ncbi:MAG TPA: hypothetical protein VKE69_08930, partial [Planctomycetota bacterium]|nr:hypothetical protein [Planctomycetota bacterium]
MSTSKLTLALAGALLAFLPVACKSTETATNANAATCCKDGNGKAECCKDGQGECCKEKKAGTMN